VLNPALPLAGEDEMKISFSLFTSSEEVFHFKESTMKSKFEILKKLLIEDSAPQFNRRRFSRRKI